MEMTSLKTQQENIKRQMLLKISSDACMLKQLADDMAESATNIQGHGYVMFVQSREKFFNELDRVSDEYCTLVAPEKTMKHS